MLIVFKDISALGGGSTTSVALHPSAQTPGELHRAPHHPNKQPPPRSTRRTGEQPEQPQNVTPHPAKPLLGRGFCAARGAGVPLTPCHAHKAPPRSASSPSSHGGAGGEHSPGTPKPPQVTTTKAEPRRGLSSPSHPPWGQARGGDSRQKGGGIGEQRLSSSAAPPGRTPRRGR